MTATALALPTVSTSGSLARYLAEIRRFPMLAPEEEYMLAQSWKEHGDISAAHRLVTSHLRLVAKIALGFRGYGLPLGELIAEGNIGLMHAVKRFEPERGFRLSTYAMWWIRAAIQEFVLRSWSLVKMGTSVARKRLFFNLKRLKHQIDAADSHDLTPEQVTQIARTLDVGEQDVIDMNHRMTASDHYLNATVSKDGDGEWMDFLVDPGESHETQIGERQESTIRHEQLNNAIALLNDRERAIFEARRLQDPPLTLEELSQHYGVSRERVRQIEARAFEKVQKTMIAA